MVAPKSRRLNLPEDIENVEINMMQFKTVESRIAYLKVMEKVTIKFYFSDDEDTNSLKNHYMSVIEKNVEEFDEYLKKEREEYKPFGYKYNEEVIELELDLYDTIEEQIEYLKNKLIEFDIDTINITTNVYDDLRRELEIRIKNREIILKKNKGERSVFGFDFSEIKKYADDLREDEGLLYLKYVLKEFDREKRENFYLFMSKEEIKYFEENIIITDPARLKNPFDLKMAGIGAKRDLAKKNFEINVQNEIEFIENKKNINIINNKDGEYEKRYQECLDRGTKYYLGHKHKRLHFIYFFMEMKKYFGEDIELIKKVYYKIVNENPVIKIFGYDYDSYKLILENCKNKSELNTLFEDEKNKVEKLKEAIHNYKAEYYIKWEKVNNQNVDEDWLEEKGFIDKNETDEVKHKNAWIKYFIENLSNRELIEILIYEFSGQMDEYEDINNKNSVKKFLEQIEKELKEYKDKIVQNYLISDSRLEKSNDDNTVGKKPKKRWSRNKSEFARFVQETYEKNKNDYKSLRDAAYKLFGDYEFEDKKWTKEKCYDLARQT